LVSGTFSEVFKELNANVRTVTNIAGEAITLDENNGNYWVGSFPDTTLIKDKDRYPIGVLDTPEVDETIIGYRRSDANVEIDIKVFDTRAEHPPKFVEKAVECLRDNPRIKKSGLFNAQLQDTTQETLTTQRGELTVHEYTGTVRFGFEVAV